MIPAIYSDLVNHALAFAAKHHEGQPRKGTTVPYLTHLANVAIILARSGCDEKTIVAGVLHDVIEDCEREGCSPESHQRQIRGKFGDDVLGAVLAVTKPKSDGARRLTSSESKAGYLEQIRKAPERSLWVSAADKLHNQRRAAFSSSSHTGPSRARTAMYSSIPSKRF